MSIFLKASEEPGQPDHIHNMLRGTRIYQSSYMDLEKFKLKGNHVWEEK